MGRFTDLQKSEITAPMDASEASMITNIKPTVNDTNQSQISQASNIAQRNIKKSDNFAMGYSPKKKQVKEDHAVWLRGQFKES